MAPMSDRAIRLVNNLKKRTYVTFKDFERQDRAARVIQSAFLRVYYDPTYSLCKRRLIRQLSEDLLRVS